MNEITIFSTCKPFEDELDISNQINAILSWRELTDDVILFGNEYGVAKVAGALGVRHVPDVRCNRWGTPFIPALFGEARQLARYDLLCYVNADIVLLRDFRIAVKRIAAWLPEFLMIGRRWNLMAAGLLSRYDLDRTRERAERWGGWKKPTGGSDYFVWPAGMMDTEIPPIVVGTRRWDLWMMGSILQRGIPLVDATKSVQAIHQGHYEWPRAPKEVRSNVRLVGTTKATVADADWELTPMGPRRK